MLHVPEIRNIVDKNPFHICSDASEDNFFFCNLLFMNVWNLFQINKKKKNILYLAVSERIWNENNLLF